MKSKFLLLICFAISSITNIAQVSINWQSDVGGRNYDVLRKICITKGAGFLAAGYSSSNHSKFKTESSRGGYDYWVIKYDNNGKIEWDKTIGGDKDDVLMTAFTTRDNGYLLAGYSFSGISGEKTQNNLGSSDYWLVKIDGAGNIEWDKTIGTLFDEAPLDGSQTFDGGYILLGELGLTKMDSLGNVEWENAAFSAHSTGYRSVQQTTKGEYLLGGDTLIFNGTTVNFFPIVLKTDELGNFKSRRILNDGPAIYNSYYKSFITKDQGILLYSWVRLNENKVYQGPIDIRKIDKQGNLLWRYTSTDFDSFYIQTPLTVKQTNDGGFVFGSSYQPQDVSGGNPDYIIGKLDSLGNLQWQSIIRGDNIDEFADLDIRGADRYIIGGSSFSGVGEDKTKPNVGNYDYWLLLVFDTTTSFAINKTSSNESLKEIKNISIYPNPVKDILHIQNTTKATFILTNQSGKIILTKKINGNDEINVSHLPAGLYYLKNNETGAVQKIMIIK